MSTFDIDIHCNYLKCRKVIGHQKACLTSCSHIFCLECANDKFGEAKVCPACDASLTQKSDIVLVQLSPSEEYKSSILAGLKPEVIIDICNRALSFYHYQISQELCYRISVQQLMESKLEGQQDSIKYAEREYHRSLKVERDKTQALTNEYEKEKRRNYDLQLEIQNKVENFNKLQQMYERLKHKTMGSMIQQSVQDSRSTFNPPRPINRLERHHTGFEPPSHYRPYHSIDTPKPYMLSGNHQEAPNQMAPKVVDPTRQETLSHPQKTQVPLAARKNTNRRPARSVIGLSSNPNHSSSPNHRHHHHMHPQKQNRHPHPHLYPPQGQIHPSPRRRSHSSSSSRSSRYPI